MPLRPVSRRADTRPLSSTRSVSIPYASPTISMRRCDSRRGGVPRRPPVRATSPLRRGHHQWPDCRQDWRTLGDYFRRLEERSRTTINVATFVGAGGVRNYVIGKDDRAATQAELERMKQLVAEAMAHGALGLSTSLQYVPDRFASTDEIVELAKVAARYGGVYFTHQRSESVRIFESLDEVFTIAERAAIPAEIWHLKTAYRANFGKMPEVLRRIEAARARGLDGNANQ